MQIDDKEVKTLGDLYSALDKQTYDEKHRSEYDLPDDYEYVVSITAKQMRVLERTLELIMREAA